MASMKILTTKDYRLFHKSGDNRPEDAAKHKKLGESMRRYGFLKCFPIVVRRERGKLVVIDGQHRLMFAESLGLPVHYVEVDTEFDVAVINSAARVWTVRDYAQKYAANGLEPYVAGLAFAERHGLPLGVAFALLAGTVSFGNIQAAFQTGAFEVTDQEWADDVAWVYTALVGLRKEVRSHRLVLAIMAVCRVPGFEPRRLIQNAKRCPEKLMAYSTRDAYLDMMEEVYNFGRANLIGLKAQSLMAMRERLPGGPAKTKEAAVA